MVNILKMLDNNIMAMSKRNKVSEYDDVFRFVCPHCSIDIEVQKKQLNCKIFRCGVFKNNGKHINPHTNKLECERLLNEQLVYGCTRPFRFVNDQQQNYVEPCGYI